MIPTLIALKDIPGVTGSFILTPGGELAARDMPAIYKDELFSEIGRRLNNIVEASADQIEELQEMLVRFEGVLLLSRRTPGFTLSILASDTVNFPALKMAANVAVRHIGEAPIKALAVPAPSAPASTKRRMWRGHEID